MKLTRPDFATILARFRAAADAWEFERHQGELAERAFADNPPGESNEEPTP